MSAGAKHDGSKRFRDVKFGKKGDAVKIPAAKVDRAKIEGRKLYEDGSLGPKPKAKPSAGRRKAV